MGFLGIDRDIREHWIYQDAEYLKVWIEMLLLARYSEEPHTELIDGELVKVGYGQFLFGRVNWSKRLKIGEQRLRNLMEKLKREEMITQISAHRKCSVYALNNYAKFNHQSNHQRTLQPKGVSGFDNQQINHLATISQPSVNHQSTTKEQRSNKEKKVTKKQNKTYTPEFDEFWNVYPRKLGKLEAFKTWERNIKNGESPTVIIQCALNYSKDCEIKQTEEQFIKHPKTFLNDERYKDFMVILVSQTKTNNQSSYQRTKSKLEQMQLEAEAKELEQFGHHQAYPNPFG